MRAGKFVLFFAAYCVDEPVAYRGVMYAGAGRRAYRAKDLGRIWLRRTQRELFGRFGKGAHKGMDLKGLVKAQRMC